MSVFTNLNQLTKEKFTGTILFKDLIVSNLIIPDYQRAYVWDSERVKILLEDLDEQINKTNTSDKRLYKFLLGNLRLCTRIKNNQNVDKYLLGSLILCEGKDKNNKKVLEVVDGQQRLITLALILRVLFNDSDSGNFLSKSEFTDSESKKHIKENYDFIKSWFETRPDKLNKFKKKLKDTIEFICILAPTLDDAFIFFDSVNAKGMRLEAYDLIKAFHLRVLLKKDNKTLCLNDRQKEELEKLKINPNDSIEVIKHYARYFEELSKENDGKSIKILFNHTLTPARQWIRYNTNKIPSEMDVYKEFCKEIPQGRTTNVQSKNSLGILQNFMGGADFFEYIQSFKDIYNDKIVRNNDFYVKLNDIKETGFVYNRYLYIAALLIYFDKFPKDNAEYMVRLIARAMFSLRVEKEKVGESTIKNYAVDEKILSLIYFANYEWELESELNKFIDNRIYKESGNNNRTKATQEYLALVQNDGQYGNCDIIPHPKPTKQQGGQNGK